MQTLWVIEKLSSGGGREIVRQGYSETLLSKDRAQRAFADTTAVYIKRQARDTDDLTNVPSVKCVVSLPNQ